MYTDRLLPHDPNAEEAVIGSLIIDPNAISKVSNFLKSEDFYQAKLRSCFESCILLFDRGEPINQISLAHELSRLNTFEEIGGNQYLIHLVESVPTSVHVEHYGEIVHRASIMRKLISAATDIAEIGYESPANTDTAIRKAEELLYQVRQGRSTRDFVHIREVLDDHLEQTASQEAEDELTTIPTGFPDIDKMLGNGLQRSDMIVVAARPSLGKSTLAFNIARHASENGAKVGIFSLEMSAEQIAVRMLSSDANVDSHRLRIGVYSEQEANRIVDAIGKLSQLQIYIDDTPIQGVVEIRGKARRLQSEKGLDLLIIDYLQLMSNSSGRSDNRVQEMGDFSRSIKGIARDLQVPVIACSQLSRAPEQRQSHRPILSDLRESGSIEQDADIVAFIYREDVYSNREDWEKSNPTEPYPENIAEIIISKHRNGPTGTVPLYFNRDIVKFDSLQYPNANP